MCTFGQQLQNHALRNEAERVVRSDPEKWLQPEIERIEQERRLRAERNRERDDDLVSVAALEVPAEVLRAQLQEDALARAVRRYMAEADADQTTTTVESIRYSNPIEFVLCTALVTAVVVLRTLRDWPARRRLNHAVAMDAENIAIARLRLRDEFVRRAVDGEIELSVKEIEHLLKLDVTRALRALGDSPLEMRELPAASGEDAETRPDLSN